MIAPKSLKWSSLESESPPSSSYSSSSSSLSWSSSTYALPSAFDSSSVSLPPSSSDSLSSSSSDPVPKQHFFGFGKKINWKIAPWNYEEPPRSKKWKLWNGKNLNPKHYHGVKESEISHCTACHRCPCPHRIDRRWCTGCQRIELMASLVNWFCITGIYTVIHRLIISILLWNIWLACWFMPHRS